MSTQASCSSCVPLAQPMQDCERRAEGLEVTPEVAAAVGIAGHDRGGRHAVWLSGRSGKGFIWTTAGGGDLSWILAGVRSFRVFKS